MRTIHSLILLGARTAARPAQTPPLSRLHITAVIDGVDELHISHRKASWIHQAWAWPMTVLAK